MNYLSKSNLIWTIDKLNCDMPARSDRCPSAHLTDAVVDRCHHTGDLIAATR